LDELTDILAFWLIYLFIYLFKTNDKRARWPLILSEVHKNTQMYTLYGEVHCTNKKIGKTNEMR